MAILETLDLIKAFPVAGGPPFRAVDRVSLKVCKGEVLGLVGESGSGKTTLAYCLARLIEPTAGRILFQGRDWLALQGRELRAARPRIQLIFQNPLAALNPVMTVSQIIEEPLRISGEEAGRRKARVLELVRRVGLPEDCLSRGPEALSGGQRQRVGVARALAARPEVVIADEPVSALDPGTRDAVLALLRELHEQSALTLIVIAHDLEVVRSLCHRCAVMWRGRIVELAETERLFLEPGHAYTKQLLAALAMKAATSPQEGPIPDLREIAPNHWVAL